ncbi:hypothetical protein GQX73_g479 [Xylaria multiplex]|uniref:Uncharacterized protein n=1 Tax=Xylaria multiplex TaxID=323545 RepID=A0A7C8J3H0_9PEZI|nr:hypothetical protein GQX73_g479 [Xylaria multiplex]
MSQSMISHGIVEKTSVLTPQQHGRFESIDEDVTEIFDFLEWPLPGLTNTPYGENQGEDTPLYSLRASQRDRAAKIHPSILNCFGEVGLTDIQRNKRPAKCVSRLDNPQKRKTENATYLPPEIMTMVIKRLVADKPRCALNFVVPDWDICRRKNLEHDIMPKNTRIVTYTRGMGIQVGSLSCKFDHGDEDHILTPVAKFNQNVAAVNENFSWEYITRSYRSHTHVFVLGIDNLPGEGVGELPEDDWRNLMPLRNKRVRDILPFDDEPSDTVKTRASSIPTPIYQDLRHIVVHSPLKLMEENAHKLSMEGDIDNQDRMEAFNHALDLDRSAHLWLSWSRMPKLESIFLDLRFYSHSLNTERRCLSKYQIIERAEEMGHYLQLKVLVLVGLQSYSFHMEYDSMKVRHVEELDTIHNEPNWIKIFRPAVREGGKIILVDKLTDELFEPLGAQYG